MVVIHCHCIISKQSLILWISKSKSISVIKKRLICMFKNELQFFISRYLSFNKEYGKSKKNFSEHQKS